MSPSFLKGLKNVESLIVYMGPYAATVMHITVELTGCNEAFLCQRTLLFVLGDLIAVFKKEFWKF